MGERAKGRAGEIIGVLCVLHKVGWHEHRFVGGMAIVSQRKKHHLRVFFCFTASETPSVFFCFTALVISTGGSVSGTVLRAHNLHNKITFRVTESIKKAASHSTICHIALRGHAERARLTQTLDMSAAAKEVSKLWLKRKGTLRSQRLNPGNLHVPKVSDT